MPLLTLASIEHAYGTQRVLDDVTLSIEPGEKIGLVGRNGSGKTTLMRIMLGGMEADGGSMQLQKGARVGYLSQDPRFEAGDTVRDAAARAFAELHRLHVELDGVYEAMAGADGAALDRLLKRQADLEGRIEAAGGYAVDHRVEATLHGVGFGDEQFGLAVGALSGGQRGRLGLARLLLEAPDLLLLDEPTNHLDIPGRQWLEQFLAEEYPGAVVVVSHDRWLLDRVVDRIVEVDRGQAWDYPGNYHDYLELRAERQLTRARVHEKQLGHVRKEEQFIRKYKAGQRAKQARGRQSRLERFKRDMIELPPELEVMRLKLPPAPRSGEQVVVGEGLSKRYGDTVLFDGVNLALTRGDRLGVIGPNGSGKTTLVRCLLGELEPDAGAARLGARVELGYYSQLHEHLDLSLTVWQYLQSVIVSLDGQSKASEQQARDLAGAFLFSGGEQDKALGDLSGGERSRAVIAGLVAAARNLLVLDEPTNHLDIPSAERLEQALAQYDGTLVLISHDRALLDATCEMLLVLDGAGGARLFRGSYSDLVAAEAEAARVAAARETPERRRPDRARDERPARPSGSPGLSLSKLEERIETIESSVRRIDRELLDPAVYTDGERCRALQAERSALQAELEPLEAEWARRAEEA